MRTRFVCNKMFRCETRKEQNPITQKGECLCGLMSEQGPLMIRDVCAKARWDRVASAVELRS
jgi:hypothetical protein